MRKEQAVRGTPFIRSGIDTGFAAALSMRPVPHVDYRVGSRLHLPGAMPIAAGRKRFGAFWRQLKALLTRRARGVRDTAESDRRWLREAQAEADLRRLHDVGILRDERYTDVLRRF